MAFIMSGTVTKGNNSNSISGVLSIVISDPTTSAGQIFNVKKQAFELINTVTGGGEISASTAYITPAGYYDSLVWDDGYTGNASLQTLLPSTAKVGDSHEYMEWTYSDGTTESVVWRLDAGDNGDGVFVILFTDTDSSGEETYTEEDKFVVRPDGTVASCAMTLNDIISGNIYRLSGSRATWPESITITPNNANVPMGFQQQFTATGHYADNTTQDMTAHVLWLSSNTGAATISNVGGSSGLAALHSTGVTTISATLGTLSAATLFTAVPASVVSATISPMNATVPNGTTLQMNATGTFSDSAVHDATSLVTWSSSNTDIAVISNATGSCGMVTAKGSGTTMITASTDSFTVSTMLTVGNDTWLSRDSGTNYALNRVIWSGSMLVAVGGGGALMSGQSIMLTSPDSTTWTTQSTGASSVLNDVVWSGSAFIAIGPTNIITSSNGSDWTLQPHGYIYQNAIAWSGSTFVSVGSDYDLSSPDGTTWAVDISLAAYHLNDIAWSGSKYAAVGNLGAIVSSSTGTTWTQQDSGVTNTLNGITWTGSQYCAVGAGGVILTSTNGTAWTSRTSGTSNDLYGVVWSGTEFVAVGAYGTIIGSPDGVNWSSRGWGAGTYGPPLHDITWTGTEYVVVGEGGLILVSQ